MCGKSRKWRVSTGRKGSGTLWTVDEGRGRCVSNGGMADGRDGVVGVAWAVREGGGGKKEPIK